jgi:hypothetical protein
MSALQTAGNQIACMLTGTAGDGQILQSEIQNISDDYMCSSDGNLRHSFQVLEKCLKSRKYDQVFVVGSAKTVRETCIVCSATDTPFQAMLFLNEMAQNGLHGVFRVNICKNTRGLCVDGHNFNAYFANFEDMVKRFGRKDVECSVSDKVNVPV